MPWAGGSLTWRPVRGQLGIGAFAAAALTAAAAGDAVVEPHAETPDGRGHQELYFVARGRATFTLDDQRVDAPARTFVFVEDPAVRARRWRRSRTRRCSCSAGDPAAKFVPAGDEYIARVRGALLADDPRRAQRLAEAVERVPELADEARTDAVLARVSDAPR